MSRGRIGQRAAGSLDARDGDDKQGRAMLERLGGIQIVRDDGHFGDIDQPYEAFEFLDWLID